MKQEKDFDQYDWESSLEMVEVAKAAVMKDRMENYAPPEQNFAAVAEVWSVLIGHKLTDADVARMMIALKLIRDSYQPKFDNRVDIVGYAMCLERVDESD